MRAGAIVTGDPGARRPGPRGAPRACEVVADGGRGAGEPGASTCVVVASPEPRPCCRSPGPALDAGLAVVVDKPLAADRRRGARRWSTRRRERGLLLTVFQNRRWDGDFLTVRRLSTRASSATSCASSRASSAGGPVPKPAAGARPTTPPRAAALLLDLGSHLVDQALQLFGPARRSVRRGPTPAARERQADDDAFVALEHDGGARSPPVDERGRRRARPAAARARGPRGAYVEARASTARRTRCAPAATPPTPDWGEEPPEALGRAARRRRAPRAVPTEPGAYQRFYAELRDALTGGAPPPVDPADAVAALALLEAAAAS